jgi:LacI family transcriptional regulator
MNELMAQVRRGRRPDYQGNLALIFLSGSPADLQGWGQIQRYLAGIESRADELGYGIARLWPKAERLSKRDISRILKGRGISGAMLIKPVVTDLELDMEWADCAWVAIGFLPKSPALHLVTPDWTSEAREAVRWLQEQGHLRIGFVFEPGADPLMGNSWLGGYALAVLTEDKAPLVLKHSSEDEEPILDWVQRERPEACVVHSSFHREVLLRAEHPPEIVMVNLSPDAAEPGLVSSCHETGINAVDLVVGQLCRGERGVPPFQKTLRTKGWWVNRPEQEVTAPACRG